VTPRCEMIIATVLSWQKLLQLGSTFSHFQHSTCKHLISMAAATIMSLPMASSLRRPAFSASRPQRMTAVRSVTR